MKTSGSLDRRTFVSAAAALAAGVVMPRIALAADAVGVADRIDVHHHMIPPSFIAAAKASRRLDPLIPSSLEWTPERSLAVMDANRIGTAIVSLGLRGSAFDDPAKAPAVARECNEFARSMRSAHPSRFGIFATLPMPDVAASLTEIRYALDVMHADGIGFMTSYGDRWLGDPSFAPIFDELNRRKALVFVHPTVANCCTHLMPGVADATVEFLFDTTRAVTELLFSGTFSRCPDVRFIFTHAGGTIPMLAQRITRQAESVPEVAARLPHGAMYELKRLHFDTATSTSTPTLAALRAFLPPDNILLGTDYPYLPPAATLAGLDASGFDPALLQRIYHDNARQLLG